MAQFNGKEILLAGLKGPPGKSAYEYAKDAGYTGTESEFMKDINPENLPDNIKENIANTLETERATAVQDIRDESATANSEIADAKAAMLSEIELAAEIVQCTGDSETAVMSQKATTEAIGDNSDKTVFDWSTRKSESYTGWVAGYYDTGDVTPSINTRASFMRTEMFIPVSAYDELTICPPAGYAVEIIAIKTDKTFEWHGHANANKYPESVDSVLKVDLTGIASVGVNVGLFANVDGDVYAADSSFCSSVIMTLTRARSIAKGELIHDEMLTNQYNWDDLACDNAPYGWITGYYSTETNDVISGKNYIHTANNISLYNVKSVAITPPPGYSIEVNAFKADGTCDVIGNANSTKTPQYIDVSVILDAEEYESIGVTVGHLGGTALTKKANKAFIDGIVMVVTYNKSPSKDEPKAYYTDEIESTVASVRNVLTEPCLVFPLITDIHYKSTSERPHVFDTSIVNMRNVIKQIPCDFVLDLGDNVGGYTDKSETLKRVAHMMNQFRTLNLPLYSAIGNHDTNYYNGDLLTLGQMYGAYISSTKDVAYNTAMCGTDYYKDFDSLNIRLVVLNGSYGERYKYSAETVNWFINTALRTDKMVLLAVHFSIINTQNYNHTGDATLGAEMVNAVSEFINDGGTLIQLCGHSHVDYAYTSPWLTVYSAAAMFEHIDLTASGYTKIQGYTGDLVAPQREVGTVSEDSWSVVVVRPNSRKINFIRFGAGDDREFVF